MKIFTKHATRYTLHATRYTLHALEKLKFSLVLLMFLSTTSSLFSQQLQTIGSSTATAAPNAIAAPVGEIGVKPYEINFSPEGRLENIIDNRGKKYKLKDILVGAPVEFGYAKTTVLSCSTTSYFKLFFEPGCGMEDDTNPVHNARRAVMCKVFDDIASFINSPLTATGNKVNIWVRNITNENTPAGVLGLASSFYIPYSNSTNSIGGILDGEIYKTIHLGTDSYANAAAGANAFYHGKIAFNFNDPAINWNTNLAINAPSNLYDLYTVILHEITHSLGFGSFMNQNGASIDPSPYYSRYDTFLRTNTNVPLLSVGSCSMYDLTFNTAVSPSVLRPGCTLPNNLSSGTLNTTLCTNAIKYVGSSTVPVYTPTCFENGSSLSHFEDMLFPNCTTPFGNDTYFSLSNANFAGTTKRYLKPEERNVLCDIGFSVKTTFGTSTTSGGFYNYGGTVCSGITVAGLNDGITSTGTYAFSGSIATVGGTSTTINIQGLLANDINVTSFECLQDITAPTTTTIINTFGVSSTISTLTTTTPGLHVLRYVPKNGLQKGSITYVYVYIIAPANPGGCSPTANSCDLVLNGNFEQYAPTNGLPNNMSQIIKACGWDWPFISTQYAPTYYNADVTTNAATVLAVDIPCNFRGSQDCKNNIGNGYADIFGISNPINNGDKCTLLTKLKAPLAANTTYQLSFEVSLQDTKCNFAAHVQAYLSPSRTAFTFSSTNFEMSTVPNPAMLFTSPTVIRNSSGWDTVTFTFTTAAGGEQFLYLGFLKNSILAANTVPIIPICTNGVYSTNTLGATLSSNFRQLGYYIDNVSIIPTSGAIFDLPTTICSTRTLNNLTNYVSGTNTNGVFSGTGVTVTAGIYSFDAAIAGIGTTTIGYTYTNSIGCVTTLYDTITISATSYNTIIVDAVNDDFSSMPIDSSTGGVTTSVYSNDIYNGLGTSSISLPNVNFTLIMPLSIAGATINSSGLISIPTGIPSGIYTLNYSLSSIGNCSFSDNATVTIIVFNSITPPSLAAGLRANNIVQRIQLQSSGKSIIAGAFTTYNNISKPYIARLNTDLTVDQTFTFPGTQPVTDIAVQADNKIIAANFNPLYGGSSMGLTRLLPNGSVDISFNVGGVGIAKKVGYTAERAYCCNIQTDGKILLGGDFGFYNGVQRLGIVRINTDGTLDASFVPNELNTYYRSVTTGITVQPDGKIILLGHFYPVTLLAYQRNIIRLNTDGSIDTSFAIGSTVGSVLYSNLSFSLYSPIAKAVVQPDGKIILSGAFTKFNSTDVKSIVRLNANGTLDSGFNTSVGVERAINDIIIEPTTNKLIIGGEFTLFGTTVVNKLIRLTTAGNLDASFSIGTGTTGIVTDPNSSDSVNYLNVLKQQPDSKIIVGGKFSTFNSISATNITRISGSAGLQAKGVNREFQSEPEIDINPKSEAVNIYPNPSKGLFTVDLTSQNLPTTIKVFNVLGEMVQNQPLVPEIQNQVDLTFLANGYYIAQISNEKIQKQYKLIKN